MSKETTLHIHTKKAQQLSLLFVILCIYTAVEDIVFHVFVLWKVLHK